MNRVIVVYRSLSGFTEKYAAWIAGELGADCVDLRNFRPDMTDKDTVIVFGGSLHAVGINGYRRLRHTVRNTGFKDLVVFAVGASLWKPGIEDEIKNANFTTDGERNLRLFYLRGGFNFRRLNLWNKLLMTLLKLKIQSRKEEDRTEEEKGMLASYETPVDAADRDAVRDIVTCVQRAAAPSGLMPASFRQLRQR
jgi:hypothetical protein